MTQATISIIDDEQQVRDAIMLLLDSVGLNSRGYESATAFLEDYDAAHPGCVITDVRMPGISGLELQKKLAEYSYSPPLIIITGHGDVAMAVDAMQEGAMDFIEKPFNDQRLLDSVHKALELDASRRGQASRIEEIRQRMESLTKREKQVMSLITQGKRNKNIADELCVSQSTVEARRAKVIEKMQADSLSDLMRMVLALEIE